MSPYQTSNEPTCNEPELRGVESGTASRDKYVAFLVHAETQLRIDTPSRGLSIVCCSVSVMSR